MLKIHGMMYIQRDAYSATHKTQGVLHIMLFSSFIGCIESIARLGDNATVGQVQKMNSHLTVGQVKRCIDQLSREGYVVGELVKHGRTGKRVFHLSDLCVTNVFYLGKAIDERSVAVGIGS